MNLPAYPKTKKSGVEWLGDIPEHWDVRRLNDVASLKTSNVDKKSVEGQSEVRLCNYVDVYYNDKITSGIEFMAATASKDEIEKFRLEKGDVVFTKDSESPFDIGIPALVDENIDDLVCGYHLAIIKASESELHGPFLFYALTAQPSVYQFTLAANGVTRFGLSQSGTKNIRVLVPSMGEQKAIAEFLDRKTGRIDELIGKKKELIEKLNEQRSALITAAVTGKIPEIGSRKSAVRMKDSGVEWIGAVPEHWEIKKFSYISSVVRGASPRPAGDPRFFNGDFTPWITVGELTKDGSMYLESTSTMLTEEGALQSRRFIDGSLILSNSGATLGVPKILKLSGCANDGVVAFENLDATCEKRYLYYYLSSLTLGLRERAKQGGQPNLNTDIVKSLSVPIPAFDEQQAIADYLDEKTGKIDGLIRKTETAIQTLEEYRTALITAAVTGKIDVRSISENIIA